MYSYAGVGSRTTPRLVLLTMFNLAHRLAINNFLLRSGAANGADTAFENGCMEARGQSEIWLPWSGFNNHSDTGFLPLEEHYQMAKTLHPRWDTLSRSIKALHARNVGQILGTDLNSPVNLVICYTPDGCESEDSRTKYTGGTGTAIALASRYGIPVYNLRNPSAIRRLNSHVVSLLGIA